MLKNEIFFAEHVTFCLFFWLCRHFCWSSPSRWARAVNLFFPHIRHVGACTCKVWWKTELVVRYNICSCGAPKKKSGKTSRKVGCWKRPKLIRKCIVFFPIAIFFPAWCSSQTQYRNAASRAQGGRPQGLSRHVVFAGFIFLYFFGCWWWRGWGGAKKIARVVLGGWVSWGVRLVEGRGGMDGPDDG